ncbi:hypothetical protein LZC95_11745 [Pendulispora brunnea]|uniref:Tetratricopeptide repeat protein n=1 Tax=Pendulispora brunnea TaxID=2905690 RepID=A0ABZ2KFQ9_9BACT
MPSRVEQLALLWRRNPDEQATIALCDALRAGEHTELMMEVGAFTRDKHATSVPCLVAAARMYMRGLRLAEAQSLLVRAGRQAPREGRIYRVLGEVLLRRGDAERAEKVFERAVAFGVSDSETRLWLERSRVFKPMHTAAGTRAVAAEVERTAPAAREGAHPFEALGELDAAVRDAPTQPRGDVAQIIANSGPSTVRGIAPPSPASPIPSQMSPAAPTRPPELPLISGFNDGMDATAVAPPSHGFEPRPAPGTRDRHTPIGLGPAPTPAPAHAPAQPPLAPPRAIGSVNLTNLPNIGIPRIADIPNIDAIPNIGLLEPDSSSHLPVFSPPTRPIDIPVHVEPPINGAPAEQAVARVPTPKELLNALELVGVYEPGAATGRPKWDKPARRWRWKSALFLVTMMLAFGGGVYGTFRHVNEKRAAAHQTAERMLTKIEDDLRTSKASVMPDTEKAFGQVFDLESRSPRAAIDWLRERALVGMLNGGREIAFEDAIARARELQIPERDYAFAQVASFLFQGDTSGAANLLPRFDGPAEKDAHYQLFAGATLERAGDARAVDRYVAATHLDPEWLLAKVLHVRLLALSGESAKASEQAKSFRAKYPDRAEGAALVALTWAHDPARKDKPPPEVNEVIERALELPLPLRVVPHAVKALIALDKHAPADAKAEIEKGLAVVDAPGNAVWLGELGISLGDEQLARKAALVAVSFSAVYPPARVLAARVALLGGRFDEALKATEGLEPTSEDVAIVRATVAYERLDVDGLERALLALPEPNKLTAARSPMMKARLAIVGKQPPPTPKKTPVPNADGEPWNDIVTMDTALDRGDLEAAKKIAAAWQADAASSLARAIRLSRLARYDGRLDDADESSRAALANGATPRALMERVLVLVARGKAAEVAPLLAKQGQTLGPLATWLNAYAAASADKMNDARGKTAAVDPPPELAPLPARIAAALALGTMKDARRGYVYIRALYDLGVVNPDTAAAGAPLGMRPPPVWRR